MTPLSPSITSSAYHSFLADLFQSLFEADVVPLHSLALHCFHLSLRSFVIKGLAFTSTALTVTREHEVTALQFDSDTATPRLLNDLFWGARSMSNSDLLFLRWSLQDDV